MAKRKAQHWNRTDSGKKATRHDMIRHIGRLEGIVQGQAAKLGVLELQKPNDIDSWVQSVADTVGEDVEGVKSVGQNVE